MNRSVSKGNNFDMF